MRYFLPGEISFHCEEWCTFKGRSVKSLRPENAHARNYAEAENGHYVFNEGAAQGFRSEYADGRVTAICFNPHHKLNIERGAMGILYLHTSNAK